MAADWPAWRGVNGLGVSREQDVPTHWTKRDNVRWRTPLPEPGNSTPIVWGNKVFLTQAIEKESRRTLMCFDRGSGKLLWQNGLVLKDPDPTHKTNPHASGSPVTDGERVIAWFGQAGIAAYDFSGKELWRRDLGAQQHVWGYGASPVLHGDRVFLNFGPGERSFLIALDKQSGKTLWQVDFPAGKGAKFANWDPKDMYGTWSTPLLVRAAGRDELILSEPHRVVAYDPSSGKVLWSCDGLGDLVYASPVVSEEGGSEPVVVAMSGFGGPALAVKVGGSGDVTATRRLWLQERTKNTIGTGVITGGNLYFIDNTGIASSLDLATGKAVWTERLRTEAEDNGVWSSPVLNQGRIYVMNKSGATFLFKAGGEFEVLAVNPLGETTNSSVVISGGDIFLRTHEALWRIGK